MKRFLTSLLAVVCVLTLSSQVQAQDDDLPPAGPPAGTPAGDPDPNQAMEDVDQSTAVHPYIEVDGQQVFYYTADGTYRYYRLIDGNRSYFAPGWRPWYLNAGLRVYFNPTPFIWFGGRPMYYYNDGGVHRYYYYRGGRPVYMAGAWRPYRFVGGVRTYYAPRIVYTRASWSRYSVRYRPLYRPTYVRTRYRYAPVRRYRTVVRPGRVVGRPGRTVVRPGRVIRKEPRRRR